MEEKLAQLEFRRMLSAAGSTMAPGCYVKYSGAGSGWYWKRRTGPACCFAYVSALGRRGSRQGSREEVGRVASALSRDYQNLRRICCVAGCALKPAYIVWCVKPVRLRRSCVMPRLKSHFVYPEVDDDIDIDINPADLRIGVYQRASQARSGQHVNRTESPCVSHIPPGIVTQCQNDRSHKNKARP